jgi:fumarate reductase subunit C
MTGAIHPYQPPVARFWWAKRRSYLLFMLRELSCVFVAWCVVYLLLLVCAVGRGAGTYVSFLDWSVTPPVVALNVVAVLFLLLHAVTWFASAPRAMVIHAGGKRVPARAVLAGHYLGWVLVSAVVAWLVLA